MKKTSNKISHYLLQEINAKPIILFRAIFFIGVLLHFLPIIIDHHNNFSNTSIRTTVGNLWLFANFNSFPELLPYALHLFFIIGCICASIGLYMRSSAITVLLIYYFYFSVNAMHINTLALWPAFSIIILFCIFPTPQTKINFKNKKNTSDDKTIFIFSFLVLFHIFGAFFFAGIEKALANWISLNPMYGFLNMPKGTIVREWVYQFPILQSYQFTFFFSWMTLFVEFAIPVLLFFKKMRKFSFFVYQTFFLGIIFMLEVPALFYLMFAGAGVLVFSIPSKKLNPTL